MSRFAHSFDYDLGSLADNQPQQENDFLRDNVWENDIYEFDITGTRNINLSLNSLQPGDDADLSLYEDTNGNSLLDHGDLQLSSSVRYGQNDDAINYRADGGTYFARVNYHSGGSDSRIDYDLDLSADITGSIGVGSSTIAVEQDFGSSLYGEAAAVETGNISNQNTSDTYAVSVLYGESYDVTLSGLTSDADLRVIRDDNNNRVVDPGEIYASSTSGGTSSDTVTIDDRGDYFVEVFQYSGNTDYTLQFDQDFV